MQGHYPVVFLAFFVGSQTVLAQEIDTCVNLLIKSVEAGTDKCTAWKDYLNCHFWGTNAETTFTTDEEIRALQTTVQNEMNKKGVNCSISVRDILSEVKQDRRNGVIRTTVRPLGFNESTNLAECSGAVATLVKENGRMSCDVFTSFVKCTIRVENWYSRPSEFVYTTLDNFMQAQMSKLNIDCVVDARSMIEEVARGNGYTTPLPRTTTPARARITTTARDPWSGIDYTTAAPSFDSRFTRARTISDCQNIAEHIEREIGLGSCSVWRSGLKCIIRVSEVYKVTDSSLHSRLQSLIDSAQSTYGIRCTEDAGILLQEVRQEQGFNSGTKLGTNMVVSLTLTISVIVSLFLGVH